MKKQTTYPTGFGEAVDSTLEGMTRRRGRLKTRKTERGFDLAEFIDRYGIKCSLQKSSIAEEDCIWLGTNDSGQGRMHLTQQMVKDLLPFLKRFAKTGELT